MVYVTALPCKNVITVDSGQSYCDNKACIVNFADTQLALSLGVHFPFDCNSSFNVMPYICH